MSRETEDWVHALYVRYAPDLYRGAKYRLQDPELAYDLVQEVFLALLDHPGRVKDHPNPGGWLWKTLQHKIAHAVARQGVRARRETGPEALDFLAAPDRPGALEDLLPPAAVPPGQGAVENGLRGGPHLPGDGPAAGGPPGHLRHLAPPGQAAVPALSHGTGRRVSL